MKIIVGWWDPTTGQLVNIPDFDHVQDPSGWLPAVVDVQHPFGVREVPRNGSLPTDLRAVPDNLGVVMRRRRIELHLNISQAAQQAGVSRTTWHEIETGKRARTTIQPRTWKAIAEVLGL